MKNMRFTLVAALVAASAIPLAAQGSAATMQRAAQARVAPGDQIVVRVAREPLLGDTVMVDERGRVVLPRIGSLDASSLTISSLRDTLLARYRTFLRDPAVDVQGLRRVVVHGEVQKPDVYLVDLATDVRGVVALAGGLTEMGHSGKVAIIRDGRRMPVADWQTADDGTADLQSGDQVVVGRRSWLAVNSLSVASTALLFASLIASFVR